MDPLPRAINDSLAAIQAAPLIARIEGWSRVNSGSGNPAGLAAMARLVADAAAQLPGKIELVDAEPVTTIAVDGRTSSCMPGQSVVLRVRPEAGERILLTGHMDTVYGPDHAFQAPRWRDDGMLNGPGVADMKGGLVVMLAALAAFERQPDAARIGYDVLINADEETGSGGSAALLTTLAAGKIAALTYEPALADGTLAGARPGSGNFAFVVRGRSAHAGRDPQQGRNAVVAAADLAVRLAAGRDAGLSVNPARIDGGGPNNIVPDLAILRVNLRPGTPSDQVRAARFIDESVADVSAVHELSITMSGSFGRPPKPLDAPDRRLYTLVRDCGAALNQPIVWRDTGGVCDGNNIAAAGVPVVDTMGVRGGQIHTAEEYLVPESVLERARLSALVLARIAQGALA